MHEESAREHDGNQGLLHLIHHAHPGMPFPILVAAELPLAQIASEKEGLGPFKIRRGLIQRMHHTDIALAQLVSTQVKRNHVGAKL